MEASSFNLIQRTRILIKVCFFEVLRGGNEANYAAMR